AWQNSRLLDDDVVASLKRLKAEDGPDLLVQGSGDLLQTLWQNGLVDELSVLIFPVVLGKGKRLFGSGTTPGGLKLVKSRSFPTCAPSMPKSGKPDFGKGEKERKRRAHLTNEGALVALASEELVIDRAAQDVAAEVRARREREVGNGRIRQALLDRAEIVVQVLGAEAPARQEAPIEADAGGPAHQPLLRVDGCAEPGRPAGQSGKLVGDRGV